MMKLATRLSLIVGGTALGILVLVTLALHTLHDSMGQVLMPSRV